MKDIFKNAKFGDIFITSEEEKVKFVMSDNHKAVLLEEDNTIGRQWLWKCNLDGTDDYGEVVILHKAIPTPMTEEYLLDKGFTKVFDDILNIENFVSSNKQIIVWNNYTIRQHPYDWYVHMGNQDMDTIGSLNFAYVDEFETFLKLCGVENYDK